jgi:hypothetical protein
MTSIRYARYDNGAVALTAFAGLWIENDSVNVTAFLSLAVQARFGGHAGSGEQSAPPMMAWRRELDATPDPCGWPATAGKPIRRSHLASLSFEAHFFTHGGG